MVKVRNEPLPGKKTEENNHLDEFQLLEIYL